MRDLTLQMILSLNPAQFVDGLNQARQAMDASTAAMRQDVDNLGQSAPPGIAPKLQVDDLLRGLAHAKEMVRQSVTGMADTATSQVARIQGSLVKIADFNDLKTQVDATGEHLATATAKVSALATELNRAMVPTQGMRQALAAAQQEVARLTGGLKEQEAALTGVRRALEVDGIAVADMARTEAQLRASLQATTVQILERERVTAAAQVLGFRTSQQHAQEVERLSSAFRILQQSGTMSVTDLARAHGTLRARTTALTGSMGEATMGVSGLTRAFSVLGGTLAAVAIGALVSNMGAFVKASIEAELGLIKTKNTLIAVTGSAADGKKEFEWLTKATDQMGLSLASSADAYAKWLASAKGTTLEGDKSRQVFAQFAQAFSILGLSGAQSNEAFLALSQMMSKGKVHAEELRGQLGERLPGAFTLAAQAMGVTTGELEKMMEAGQLMSSDFLPKLGMLVAKTFGGMAGQLDQSGKAFTRLESEWIKTKAAFAEAGAMAGVVDITQRLTATLRENKAEIEAFGKAFGTTLDVLVSVGRGIGDFAGKVIGFSTFVAEVTGITMAVEGWGMIFGVALDAFDDFMGEGGKLVRTTSATTTAALTESSNTLQKWKESVKASGSAMHAAATGVHDVLIKAIEVSNSQISAFNTALEQRRPKLKQAVENEQQSWHAIGEAAASASKSTTDQLTEEYARRQNRLTALQSRGAISATQIAHASVALTIQEADARIAEERRYLNEALAITNEEFQAKINNAKRLELDTNRIEEERLSSQKKLLQQTEASSHQSINKLIAEEKRHLDAAKQMDEQRGAFRSSVEDRLSRLAEKKMNPAQLHQSRQQRIAQEQAKAEEALQNGNYEAARKHAEKAMELAESNAAAVKVGNKTILSENDAIAQSAEQIKKAAMVADQAYRQEGSSHLQMAGSIREEYTRLSLSLDKVRAALTEVGQNMAKVHQLVVKADIEDVKKSAAEIDALLEKKQRTVDIKVKLQDEANIFDALIKKAPELGEPIAKSVMDGLKSSFDEFKKVFKEWDPEIRNKFDVKAADTGIEGLTEKIAALQTVVGTKPITNGTGEKVKIDSAEACNAVDRVAQKLTDLPTEKTITVTVRQVAEEARAAGGMVGSSLPGFAVGGYLPGSGGGIDTVVARLSLGEYVVREDAVKHYGAGLFHALNSMRLKLADLPRFAVGGLVNNLRIPTFPQFAAGGPVMASGQGQTVNINLSFGGQETFPVQTDQDNANRLLKYLQKQARGM